MKQLATLLFFFTSTLLTAQKANNWYFGFGAGLNFANSGPTVINNGLSSNLDNSSSISDQNGNLLFYTDGMTVWNKNHVVMPNGSGLTSHASAGQCAVIVPVPCNANKYVIFQVTEFATPGYLKYTVVDMSLASGFGDVVSTQKNVSLGTGWTEKICAYYNPTNNNYWVLVHKWGDNQFVAFDVNSNSIATQSVVTSIGSIHNCGTYSAAHDAMGQLTISPDGSKVINALTCQDKFELFDFNIATGVLSNYISLPGNGGAAWGTAFSPDSKKIYTNSIFGQSIYQYDITTYNQSSILASQVNLYTTGTGGYNFGYMELGPNNKLYIARPNTNFLSVVNNPNIAGAGCNFAFAGQGLGPYTSSWGLPRIAYNSPNGGAVISINSSPGSPTICAGNQLVLTAGGASSYTWNTGSNNASISISPSVTTSFTVSGAGGCIGNTVGSSTITVSVMPTPVLSISGNTTICAGESVTITASGAASYSWSNGFNASTVVLSPTTTSVYTVSGNALNSNCLAVGSHTLIVHPKPVLSISGNTAICAGQTASLLASGASSYWWNLNLPGGFLNVTPLVSTSYSVVGTDTNSCQSSTFVNVVVSSSLTLQVSGNTLLCYGGTASLTASGASTYSWNSIGGGAVYTVSPNATIVYTVSGIDNQSKCTGKTTVTVSVRECLGIMEAKEIQSISVYPNPFSEKIILRDKNQQAYAWQVGIYNALGELVYQSEQLKAVVEFEIDTNQLPAGVYFLKLRLGKQTQVTKIIKQ